MRIDNIHIDSYAGFNDLNLVFSDGFQVVKSLNEDGKTSLLAFIRGVIFGFKYALPEHGTKTAPFHTDGVQMGGRIEVTVELDGKERHYAIIRHTPKQDGTLSIRDIDSGRLIDGGEATKLRDLILGGVDKTLFKNVFVLTAADLQDLSLLTDEEVAHAFFAGAAGVGLELPRELSALNDEMKRLYVKETKGRNQRHRKLTAKVNDLSREIGTLIKKMKELSGQRGDREKMSRELEGLRKIRSGLVKNMMRASDRITARKHKSRIEELKDEIDEFLEGPFPTDSDQTRLESLRDQISTLEGELDGLDGLDGLNEEIESLETKQSNLTLDTAAEGSHSSLEAVRVSDLFERVAEVEHANNLRDEKEGLSDLELEEGVETRLKEALSRQEKIEDEIEELTDRETIANSSLGEYEPQVLDAGPASEIDGALTSRISQHSDPLDRAKGEVKRIEGDLKAALKSAGGMDAEVLDELPLDTANLIGLRISLSKSGSAPRSRFAHIQTLIALSALVLGLGIAFILDEMLGGGGLALIGLLLLILDQLETQGAEGATELSGSVKKQLKRLGLPSHASAKDLERHVDRLSDASTLYTELRRAESSRDEVEELYTTGIQLLNRLVDDCGLEAVDAGASAAHLEGVLKDLMETHRYAVAQVRVLNEELTKVHARKGIFSGQLEDNTTELNDILAELEEEDQESATAVLAEINRRLEIETELERLASAESAVEKIRGAVNAACKSVGDEEPSLHNLAIVYAEQLERAKEAVQARGKYDEWERQLIDKRPRAKRRKTKKGGLEDEATGLLASFKLGLDDEMGPAVEGGKHRLELEGEMKDEQGQFTNLAKRWDKSLEDFGDELEEADPDEDEAICTEQERRDESLGDEISTRESQLFSLSAELLNLDESDELTRKQAEKKATQAELDEVNLRWAHLFLVRFIIQRTREQYEGSHGSEVLIRASEHLRRITDGRYTQIMRVAEPPGYRLIDWSGSHRSPIKPDLSRGAFAQVYLCIRLAYAEKGAHSNLPIILDDAYESWDDERVLHGVDILCELGETGRQVMMFTHHGKTICEYAESRGVEVIQLEPTWG